MRGRRRTRRTDALEFSADVGAIAGLKATSSALAADRLLPEHDVAVAVRDEGDTTVL